jgi:hypothetical protein
MLLIRWLRAKFDHPDLRDFAVDERESEMLVGDYLALSVDLRLSLKPWMFCSECRAKANFGDEYKDGRQLSFAASHAIVAGLECGLASRSSAQKRTSRPLLDANADLEAADGFWILARSRPDADRPAVRTAESISADPRPALIRHVPMQLPGRSVLLRLARGQSLEYLAGSVRVSGREHPMSEYIVPTYRPARDEFAGSHAFWGRVLQAKPLVDGGVSLRFGQTFDLLVELGPKDASRLLRQSRLPDWQAAIDGYALLVASLEVPSGVRVAGSTRPTKRLVDVDVSHSAFTTRATVRHGFQAATEVIIDREPDFDSPEGAGMIGTNHLSESV